MDSDELWAFARRTLVVVAIVGLVLLLWQLRQVLLLTFAGVVVASILVAAADPISRFTPLPHRWALLIAALAIVLAFGLFTTLIGAQVVAQATALINELPRAIEAVEQRFGITLPGPEALQRGEGARQAAGFSAQVLSWLAAWGASVMQVVTNLILVLVIGVFFAIEPAVYRRGLAMLFPRAHHERVQETLITCGRALRLWLIGQLISMALVGALVTLGTWLIGLPGPLALGLFAAMTEFIPTLGPIIGAAPALLFAATQGLTALVWTAVLFIAIQQIESNIITPLVERRMVSIPPALFLAAVLAFGALFGVLGVILAAPLTVLAYTATNKLYVREILGRDARVPGE
ncbi:MAG: AI-2E family transporter [Hyphomicrobiales bacterium]|nr:AI-2E family transporter [Hyphomicrobiales bacterium]